MLDFSFLGRVMSLMTLDPDEQLEIIRKINRVESWLQRNKGA